MDLLSYIENAFPDGLAYDDAAQLCLRLFNSVDGLPDSLKEQCNKNNLAETFAKLSVSGFIKGSTVGAALYGANHHEVTDKGHWVEVIASVFKISNSVNSAQGEKLFKSLTLRSSGTAARSAAAP